VSATGIRQEVLSDAMAEAIDGRQVRAAVFTTYSFDPGFFELHILPMLFDYPFSLVEKVKRIQLEDQLTSMAVAVYYDRAALAQDALPAQLDFRRFDVRRSTGAFHPKLVILLVENLPEEDPDDGDAEPESHSLIVGVLSANLTRAGWWENVEAGHFEEIDDRDVDPEPCSFRHDLLSILRRIRRMAPEDEKHEALNQIQDFLKHRTATRRRTYHRAAGRYYTRMYVGQEPLADWIEGLRLSSRDWNVEIISPFFDRADVGTLQRLVDVLDPREVRVYLPVDLDGKALVTEDLYESIDETAHWSSLPASIVRAGKRAHQERAVPRRVHAKVYRLWNRDQGQVILVGSVNLTAAGHSRANAGNLEAAFLVDNTDEGGKRRWWLDRREDAPASFHEQNPEEDDEAEDVCVDVSFRYDWRSGDLSYRIERGVKGALQIEEPGGQALFAIHQPVFGSWVSCGDAAARAVRDLLPSTSFLRIRHDAGFWRVLVREERMLHRPSLLASLTPEEILMYWSLLSPDQQAAFIEEKLAAEGVLAGLQPKAGRWFSTQNTVFDRFAGCYHAFESLFRHVSLAIRQGRTKDARTRLFGAKYDSLPELLRKVLERTDGDPVLRFVTYLCGRQVCDRVKAAFPSFWKEHRGETRVLLHQLGAIDQIRDVLPLAEGADREAFLSWYEKMFVGVIEPPGTVA
jgi:hypothetical protein